MLIPVLVALGSAVGGVARWAVSNAVDRRWPLQPTPWLGTLLVNIVGCFAIGVVAALVPSDRPALRALLMTGVLGGFTTFSSFTYHTHALLGAGRHGEAALVTGLSLAACVLGTIGGWALGARLAV